MMVCLFEVGPPFFTSKVLSGDIQHLIDTRGLNSTGAARACDPTDDTVAARGECSDTSPHYWLPRPSSVTGPWSVHSPHVYIKDSFFPIQ